MGSGGTLVDGVRRWFQRRATTNTNTGIIINNNSNNSNNNHNRRHSKSTHVNHTCGHVASVTELRAQSSGIRKRKELKEEEQEEEEEEEGEFDISVLKLIKVPKRNTHFISATMDSQKKVSFLFPLYFLSLFSPFGDLGFGFLAEISLPFGLIWGLFFWVFI
jgi:hypothetical protein